MPAPTTGLVNAHLYLLLVREVQARGLDPIPPLRQCGMTLDQLNGLGSAVPADKALRLMTLLAELTGDPGLGLKAGRRAELADLDLAGLMLRASPDVPAATAVFDGMTSASAAIFSTQIIAGPDGVVVRYLPEFGGSTPRLLHDTFLVSSITLSQAVLGPYAPTAVHTAVAEPGDASEYRRVLVGDVRFSMPWTQFTVPSAVADAGPAYRDDVVASVVQPHLHGLSRAPAVLDIASRLRGALVAALAEGPPNIEQMADRLAMSPRTLRRRLQADGTTFQQTLEEAKHELALQHLGQQVSGTEIAAILGYAEPQAFYRAFKRWTGMSLTRYQGLLRGDVATPTP